MKKTAKTDNSSDPKTLCYNILSTICILTLATVLAFSFFHITRSDPANIALIYILALIIIARITSGYVFGIISALFCVIFINWCFTYPYFKVNFQIHFTDRIHIDNTVKETGQNDSGKRACDQ